VTRTTEWTLAECRREYRALEQAHQKLARDSERNAAALIDARDQIDRLRRRIAELEAERDAALGGKPT
jgi:chromosome segregation ATPase